MNKNSNYVTQIAERYVHIVVMNSEGFTNYERRVSPMMKKDRNIVRQFEGQLNANGRLNLVLENEIEVNPNNCKPSTFC